MSSAMMMGGASTGASSTPQRSMFVLVLQFLALAVINALGLLLVYSFLYDEAYGLALAFAVITLMPNIFFFFPRMYPLRWMTPGFMFITLLVVYPIVYTVQVSFTNLGDKLGDSHLLSKSKTIQLIEGQDRLFVPEGAPRYRYTLYQSTSEEGLYALWLTNELPDGTVETLFAPLEMPVEILVDAPEDAPDTYEGYEINNKATLKQQLLDSTALFGEGEQVVTILSTRYAGMPSSRYEYDGEQDVILDNSDGRLYFANDDTGYFEAENGDQLRPGYQAYVGLFNFTRLLDDPRLRGPLVDIFVWTVLFALLTVFTTFAMGLAMAMIMDNSRIPGRKIIRSLLIIPYAIPGAISILIWRGMLNENIGIITNFVAESFGIRIPWFSDGTWAKVAIIMVNLWLGYPYMMLICSGALQAIPSDIYEAAAVDGAKPWQRFRNITLPLLLITVGPLLIASFVFNFNNYLLIELLTKGNPPIMQSPVPAGETDILITYTYGLAFGDQGRDFGYASAITIVIFAIVALVTLFQYRYTRTWEEVGENV